MKDPVIEIANKYFQKAVEAEKKKEWENAKYYYAQAAIKYLQSASYSDGILFELKIKRAMECKRRLKRILQTMGEKIGGKFVIEKTNIRFSDVVGLDEIKERIKIAIVYPKKYKELYEKFGIKSGGRILLYGPPGCGKTLIAKACAGETGLPFYQGDVAKLMSKWVGEAEKNVSALFDTVKKEKKAILFLDEIDALGASREIVENSTVARRVVTQLLVEISNLPEGILLIAATNLPWALDPALIRTGRLGTPIFIPPPDEKMREMLFKKFLQDKPTEDIDIKKLVELTEGFSSSDIIDVGGLCEWAASIALQDAIKTGIERGIRMDDFLFVLEKGYVKPSVYPWVVEAAKKLKRNKMLAGMFPELVDFVEKYMERVATKKR